MPSTVEHPLGLARHEHVENVDPGRRRQRLRCNEVLGPGSRLRLPTSFGNGDNTPSPHCGGPRPLTTVTDSARSPNNGGGRQCERPVRRTRPRCEPVRRRSRQHARQRRATSARAARARVRIRVDRSRRIARRVRPRRPRSPRTAHQSRARRSVEGQDRWSVPGYLDRHVRWCSTDAVASVRSVLSDVHPSARTR